jgi:hypothetical protein
MHRQLTLSLDPIVTNIANYTIGDSPNIWELMTPPKIGGTNRYMAETHDSMHESLVPGPGFWHTNARGLNQISELINSIFPDFEEKTLWCWVRNSLTKVSSAALFGKYHPLGHDPILVQAVWYFKLPIRKIRVFAYSK